jgi:hypothetical protein
LGLSMEVFIALTVSCLPLCAQLLE